MRTLSRLYLALPLLVMATFLVTACSKKPQLYRGSVFTFGTIVDYSIAEADPAVAQRAINAIQQDLDYMHVAFHAWHPGPLGRINQLLATTGTFTANPSVLPLIQESRQLSIESQGLFNPAIGHLIKAWGFQSDEGNDDHAPPDPAEIKAWLAKKPQMTDIVIKNIQMRSTNPAVRLDLGAVAKGYAVEKIIEHLQELGIKNAIINAGGDIKAIGEHPDGRPWYVGITHPRQKDAVLAGLDVMPGESVFTSGDYERFFTYQGKRYDHIIDPRTGYPANQTESVTVISSSATRADAAATALFIAGPSQWPTIAKAMHIKYVLLIDAHGHGEATPAMLKRLKQINPSLKIQSRSLP